MPRYTAVRADYRERSTRTKSYECRDCRYLLMETSKHILWRERLTFCQQGNAWYSLSTSKFEVHVFRVDHRYHFQPGNAHSCSMRDLPNDTCIEICPCATLRVAPPFSEFTWGKREAPTKDNGSTARWL